MVSKQGVPGLSIFSSKTASRFKLLGCDLVWQAPARCEAVRRTCGHWAPAGVAHGTPGFTETEESSGRCWKRGAKYILGLYLTYRSAPPNFSQPPSDRQAASHVQGFSLSIMLGCSGTASLVTVQDRVCSPFQGIV